MRQYLRGRALRRIVRGTTSLRQPVFSDRVSQRRDAAPRPIVLVAKAWVTASPVLYRSGEKGYQSIASMVSYGIGCNEPRLRRAYDRVQRRVRRFAVAHLA